MFSEKSFCSARLSFILCSFGCSVFRCLFGFRRLNYANFNCNDYSVCVSTRHNSLFTSLPLFTRGHKTTTAHSREQVNYTTAIF